MLGSEDIYKVIKTGERYSYDIAYNPIDKVLLEMGINLTGTNNRYQSVTMLISQLMNVTGTLTEKYILMKGSQCDTTTIDVTLRSRRCNTNMDTSEDHNAGHNRWHWYACLCAGYDCNALDGNQRRRQLTNL